MKNRILDRYVTRKFFKALLISLLSFLFIYIITNLFERIGYFIDRDAAVSQIMMYYLLFSPKIVVRIMPLATLLGVYFSLGLITKHNEVLAIRGLGIPPIHIYRPIFIYGFLVTAVVLFFNLSFVPRSRHLLDEYRKEKIDRVRGIDYNYARNINYITEDGWVVKIDKLKKDDIFRVDLYRYENNRLVERIFAKRGVWEDSVWTLKNVWRRKFSERGISEYDSREYEASRILKVNPEELSQSKENPLNLPFGQLLSYIQRMEKSGQVSNRERVELFSRISYPFMSFIILFFGCPLALEVKRRGLIFGFGLGILSSFVFWGIIQLFKELGVKGTMLPSLAATIPYLVFLGIGIYLLSRKEPL